MRKNWFITIVVLLIFVGLFFTALPTVQAQAAKTITVGAGGDYTTIQDAVTEAYPGDTVRLLENISTTSSFTISKTLTFDTNGFNVTRSNATSPVATVFTVSGVNFTVIGTGTITSTNVYGTTGSAIYIQNNGSLTLDGATLSGGYASVYSVGTTTTSANFTMNGGELTNGIAIEGKLHTTIINDGLITSDEQLSPIQGSKDAGGTIIINDGTIERGSSSNAAIDHPQVGDLIINGGTITGPLGIEIRQGNLTITGDAVINGTAGDAIFMNGAATTTGSLTANISGGIITSTGGYALRETAATISETKDIIITSGKFSGSLGAVTFATTAPDILKLTGGAYNTDPAAFVSYPNTTYFVDSWWYIDSAVAPILDGVTPVAGEVVLAPTQNFVLTVDAADGNLYELEIDHNMQDNPATPEFSVYASVENPYGTDADRTLFEETFGVHVTYDGDLQKWTIDFGPSVTNSFITNGGIIFYMVLEDLGGNTWGSMDPTTEENTFSYTFEAINSLEPEITSAVTYVYTPVYDYVGAIEFDDTNNIFTATYSPDEFLAGGAMNDLARYLGALYRQDDSTIIKIVYDAVEYTWNTDGTLKGSNWEDTDGKTLVSAMVTSYLSAPGDLVVTVSDGWHTAEVTFSLIITSALEEELAAAPGYEYDPPYVPVGDVSFDIESNTYTGIYTAPQVIAGAPMNDMARYLGALYRQEGSTITSIVYKGINYTWWMPEGETELKGSNWRAEGGNTLISVVTAEFMADLMAGTWDPEAGYVMTVHDNYGHSAMVTFKLVILNTLEPEIASAVTYEYVPVYNYVGDIHFASNTFTAIYADVEFAPGAMYDLARYLGALYWQEGSTITSIVYDETIYTWNTAEPNNGSNWYNGPTSLVSAMVADYETTPGDLVIKVTDGFQTLDVIFQLVINSSTLEAELASAAEYKYDPPYIPVGDIVFDLNSITYTGTYTASQVCAGAPMNDMARYLGALYRQDGSSITSIVYNGTTYTWDVTGDLVGSNWEDVSGTTLVSQVTDDFKAAVAAGTWDPDAGFVMTFHDDYDHSATVTFKLVILNTLGAEIASAPDYDYSPVYTYIGSYAFEDITNIYTVTYNDTTFAPGAMNDLARYLGALYLQTGATVASIEYDGEIFTWYVPAGETELKGSNWRDTSGNTLVGVITAQALAGHIDPAVGITLTLSDIFHIEDVIFKFVILDTTAPEILNGVAKSSTDGDVTLVDGKFTVDQGFEVDTIEITMVEPVLVDIDTVVTMVGYGEYGTVTAHDGALITITPAAGNETAALIGIFTFTVPEGSVTDLRGNVFVGSIILEVLNVAPIAVDDTYATDEDTTLVVAAPGVLANDGDIDQDNLASYVLTQPGHGTLTLASDGSFTYVPEADWSGTDTFTYQLVATPAINEAWTDEALVTITVKAVDDDPIIEEIGDQTIIAGDTLTFTVIATDPEGKDLTYSLGDTAPEGATIDPATGEFSWDTTDVEPDDDYTFDVCVSDGVNTVCETITVTVEAVLDPLPIKIYLPLIFR